jgi:hypothetical protein
MHPALQYDLMQARQHDMQQSAARQRRGAQAKAAHRPARDRTAAVPRQRVLRLVRRLLPA